MQHINISPDRLKELEAEAKRRILARQSTVSLVEPKLYTTNITFATLVFKVLLIEGNEPIEIVVNYLTDLLSHRSTALDTETYGDPIALQQHEAFIRTLPISDKEKVSYIKSVKKESALRAQFTKLRFIILCNPVTRQLIVIDWLKISEDLKIATQQTLNQSVTTFWAHNMLYDYMVLSKHGIFLQNIKCSLLARIMTNFSRGVEQNGLKEIAKILLNDTLKDEGGTTDFSSQNLSEDAYDYVYKDGAAVSLLVPIMEEKLKCLHNPALLGNTANRAIDPFELNCDCIKPFAEMQLTGLPTDLPCFLKDSANIKRKLERIKKPLINKMPKYEGTPLSTEHLRQYLTGKVTEHSVEALLDELEKTAKGQPSFGKKSLKILLKKLPAEVKKFMKSWFHYVDLKSKNSNDGYGRLAQYSNCGNILHSSYRILGASTGRTTSRACNLQNMPRDKEGLRSMIKAPKGYVFVLMDFSQQELRVAAHGLNLPIMKGFFAEGADLHERSAELAYKQEWQKASLTEREIMRTKMKGTGFAIFYGAHAKGIAAYLKGSNLSVTLEEADSLLKTFLTMYGLEAVQKKWVEAVERNRAIKTALGMPVLLSPDQNASTKAVNTFVQGSSAEMSKIALANWYKLKTRKGMQAKVVNFVHDELQILCPVSEQMEVIRDLSYCGREASFIILPSQTQLEINKAIDVSIGNRLSKKYLTKIKEDDLHINFIAKHQVAIDYFEPQTNFGSLVKIFEPGLCQAEILSLPAIMPRKKDPSTQMLQIRLRVMDKNGISVVIKLYPGLIKEKDNENLNSDCLDVLRNWSKVTGVNLLNGKTLNTKEIYKLVGKKLTLKVLRMRNKQGVLEYIFGQCLYGDKIYNLFGSYGLKTKLAYNPVNRFAKDDLF